MRSRSLLIRFLVLSLSLITSQFFTYQLSLAAEIASKGVEKAMVIKQMAEVMLNLKHYPSESDKKMLQDISLNTENADDERILATAMMNLHHQVHSADKPRLKAIINDETTSAPIKTLATIMLNLDHTLSEGDRKTLKELLR